MLGACKACGCIAGWGGKKVELYMLSCFCHCSSLAICSCVFARGRAPAPKSGCARAEPYRHGWCHLNPYPSNDDRVLLLPASIVIVFIISVSV